MTQNNEREMHLTKVLKLTALERAIELQSIHGNGAVDLDCLTVLQDMVDELKTPISQNEQQEAVTNLWEALGKWSAYLASNGEQANLAPPSWLIDAVSSATSPPKQIPDGWKLVVIEPTYEMLSAVLFNTEYAGDNESLMTTAYKAMINASPTNTEVGE